MPSDAPAALFAPARAGVAAHRAAASRAGLDRDRACAGPIPTTRCGSCSCAIGSRGQGWYDLSQYGVAGAYESHWSRLIDAGLGGMLWLFGLFAEPAMAERLMRTVWPMLWLLPTMAAAAAIAWRIAGREAALVALLMAVIGLPALHQFRPGRIDHHNVQIALSLLAVAATVWSDRVRWAAVAAGAVTGLAWRSGSSACRICWCAAPLSRRAMCWIAKAARAASDYGLALAVSSVVGVRRHRGTGSLDAGRVRRHRDQLGGADGRRRARAGNCGPVCKRPCRCDAGNVLVVGAFRHRAPSSPSSRAVCVGLTP